MLGGFIVIGTNTAVFLIRTALGTVVMVAVARAMGVPI